MPVELAPLPAPTVPVDPAQMDLIGKSWTVVALPPVGISIPVPPAWVAAAASLPSGEADIRSATKQNAGFARFMDQKLAEVRGGQTELVATARGGAKGFVVDVYGGDGQSAQRLADQLLLDHKDATNVARDAVSLPVGPAIHLAFNADLPWNEGPGRFDVYLIDTGRGGAVIRARAQDDVDLRPLATMAQAVRRLAGTRMERTTDAGLLAPIVLILDNASDMAGPPLEGEKTAAIRLLENVGPVPSVAVVTTGDADHVAVPLQPLRPDLAARAIAAIEPGGRRDLGGAVEAAMKILGPVIEPYPVLVAVAGGTGGLTAAQLKAATQRPAKGLRFVAVALGAGPQEAALSGGIDPLYGVYSFARTPADLPLALDLGRVEMRFPTGSLLDVATAFWPPDGSVWRRTFPVDGDVLALRVCAQVEAAAPRVALIQPSGGRLDDESTVNALRVSEQAGRTCLAVERPAVGSWTLEVQADARARERPVEAMIYAPLDTLHAAKGVDSTGGAGWPVSIGYAFGDQIDDMQVRGALRVTDPAGNTRPYPAQGGAGYDYGGVSGGVEVGAEVYGTGMPGTYLLDLKVTGTLGGTAAASGDRFQRAAIRAVYVAPNTDSDGDGVPDDLESRYGMNPRDATDGRADPDADGLSTARELMDLGTDPMDKDSDGGGESDGSEVTGGRDPLDDRDDVKPASCLDAYASAYPSPPSYPPGASFPPDSALQATLPKTIVGLPTTTGSRMGGGGDWLGQLYLAMAVCVGKSDADLSFAWATSDQLDSWLVQAIRVDGVSGSRLEQAFLEIMPNTVDRQPPQIRRLAEKTYRTYTGGLTAYVHDGTLYLVSRWVIGDRWGTPAPGVTAPPSDDRIVEDVIRQLP